jgi:chitinase
VPATYNILAVSFADSTATPGAVSFTIDSGLSACLGGYTDEQFIADIRVAHSKGQKVVISIGGELGQLTVNSDSIATTFANSVYSLMQRFGFDGVDIDLEHGISPTHMSKALHMLAARAPGVIITTAPQTLDMQNTQSPYFQLSLLIKDILTMSNTQYYNSGTMLGCDGKVYAVGSVDFLTALACTQLQGGLNANQLGLGLPASPSGAGSGYVSPTIVANALRCIATGTNCGSFKMSTTYPSFRGAMTWSINWDASNGYQFANTVGAALAALP